MAYQTTFKRYELKYLLTRQQKAQLLRVMEPYMALDEYGRTTIRNLYFDTDTYRLARRSIERPAYKEKLRVRSYGPAGADSPVFVELKKKYDSVVYKRRLALPNEQAMAWLCGDAALAPATQISREIDYFRDYYESLRPVAFLSYEREAFRSRGGDDFRVTFDDTILFREEALTLEAGAWGTPLLGENHVLMELKTPGGIPLWMVRFLSGQRVYKTSFSKYGTAYETLIYPNHEGGRLYA